MQKIFPIPARAGPPLGRRLPQCRVNGRLVAEGLALAGKLGHEATAFTRQYRIPQGQFLGLGTDPSSLDGRYYGPLPQDRIRGRARVLF